MPSLSVMIKPASGNCNLRCSYCFYREEAANRACADRGIMTEQTAQHIIEKAFAYVGGDRDAYLSFAFQGGEPLLAGLPFFRAFVDTVRARNNFHIPVEFSLQTNGMLIDAAYASFFAQEQFLIGLSLDGIPAVHNAFRTDTKGHGTFDAVCRAARLLRTHGVPYNILCVVTDALCAHGKDVWQALCEHRYLQFIPCLPPLTADTPSHAPTQEHYAQFLDAIFDGYYRAFRRGSFVSVRTFDNWLNLLLRRPPESCAMCGICMPTLVIEADGTAYPCDFYAMDEYLLGNLCDSGTTIANLLTSPKMYAFLAPSHAVSDTCRRCRYYPLCRNGCRKERTLSDGRTHQCTAIRRFFDAHIGQLEEMADHIERSMHERRLSPR